jgi:hypothetical protein
MQLDQNVEVLVALAIMDLHTMSANFVLLMTAMHGLVIV